MFVVGAGVCLLVIDEPSETFVYFICRTNVISQKVEYLLRHFGCFWSSVRKKNNFS